MSYVVLARKYRPLNFEDVVGQSPVSQTLTHALEMGRIAHAYVFSGPRGIGKTTTARILAKCLNCEKGPTIHPCQRCPSCQSIGQGTSMTDVLEIDGASNRGIEQIRELRENAKYTPTASRYRIFIIDEAHQITKDAFGALLKTLEEPPDHVIFMLATTEAQRIPAPILSRCQRFSLRPIPSDLVFEHLKKICGEENIKAEEDALTDIVRFVEGSMRDALSLLDQAQVFSPEKITSQTLRELLGILPLEIIQGFAKSLQDGDPSSLLQQISQHVRDGVDLSQLAKDLQEHYHECLLLKAGVTDLNLSSTQGWTSASVPYDFSTLERNIRLLSQAINEMRKSDTPRAVFEIYALRIGQKTMDPRTLLEQLERMEPKESLSPPQPSSKAPLPPPSTPASHPPVPNRSAPATAPVQSVTATKPRPSESTTKPQNNLAPQFKEEWRNAIGDIALKKQALASALEEADVQTDGTRLTLTFQKSFSLRLVEHSKDIVAKSLGKRVQTPVSIETRLASSPTLPEKDQTASAQPANAPPAFRRAERSDEKQKMAMEWEDVSLDQVGADIKNALKIFPGTLKREVKPS